MILKYFGFLTATFAKQPQNGIFKNNILTEKFADYEHESFFGQPRFNGSCDSDSQGAARECEDRGLTLFCKDITIIKKGKVFRIF